MSEILYQKLLESTNAIPWHIDWPTLSFTYVGPQIETLLGWEQNSWKSVSDWAERMHPDDREKVVNFCVSQSQSGHDHEADYRALTANGHYIWIRDVVHVIRNQAGEVESLVGFMFDITERKKNEEALEAANRKLERMSYIDGLTHIANRRQFDETLDTVWNEAIQNQFPVSLIILDIDFFKAYNDRYGHCQGDVCLVKVAQALSSVVDHSTALVARYGGEEFVLLLPDTSQEQALQYAKKCAEKIAALKIVHSESTVSSTVSLSIGVSTDFASKQKKSRTLIEATDALLYKAKRNGRNRIESV